MEIPYAYKIYYVASIAMVLITPIYFVARYRLRGVLYSCVVNTGIFAVDYIARYTVAGMPDMGLTLFLIGTTIVTLLYAFTIIAAITLAIRLYTFIHSKTKACRLL